MDEGARENAPLDLVATSTFLLAACVSERSPRSDEAGAAVFAALRPLAEDPGVLGLYERLDELEGARVDDPRVAPLAAELVAAVPDEVLAVLPAGEPSATGFGRVLLDDYPPAQREVVRRVMEGLAGRVRGREGA